MEDVDDELSLLVLQDAADGTDHLLSEAVMRMMKFIASRNEANNILNEGTARVRVGNEWSASVLSGGVHVMDKTENKAGAITAHDGSIVHIGTTYGGRGIFD